ncbi:MAG: sensor histidine kinase [Thermodesulfobacteriota bacterium]
MDKAQTPWATSVLVFLVFCAIGFSYLRALVNESDAAAQLALETTVQGQTEALQAIILKAQAPLYTLADILAVRKGEFDDFDSYASYLLQTNKDVSGLFLTKDGVVSAAHPLAGNEAALGHDLLKDPDRRKEVEEAINTGRTVLAGPVNMRQGGVGLFARKPVFWMENGERRFWGLVVALINWETVKKAIETEAGATGCSYVLMRRLTSDPSPVLLSRSAGDVEPERAVTRSLSVPGGEWIITMSPGTASGEVFHIAGAAIVLAASFTASILVFLLLTSRLTILTQAASIILANEELQKRLDERNLLIKEVHHRVKNNLQVIISLLDLQSHDNGNEEFKTLVAACKGRVKAIALAHEQIYKGSDVGMIDVKNYLEGILVNVLRGFTGEARHVEYSVASEGGSIPLGKAVPVGLIVTELVTNSLKYAFDGVDKPLISITLGQAGPDRSLLTVRDNGQGFQNGICPESGSTLGIILVKSLSGQLGGAMRCHNDGGAVVEVEFPLGNGKTGP